MAKVVWKYFIPLAGCTIQVPNDGYLCHVAAQGESGMLWYFGSPDAPRKAMELVVLGTGQIVDSPERLVHLGTALTPAGFVWHVFERVQQ